MGEYTRTCSQSRTPASDRRWALPWTPAPRIASTRASGLASARVATAVTAAVRISVTAEALRIAVGMPVSPSNSVTVPWWVSSPRDGLLGIRHSALSPNVAPSPPPAAKLGISPINPGAPASSTTERSGVQASPRAWAASAAAIACSHSSGASARCTAA